MLFLIRLRYVRYPASLAGLAILKTGFTDYSKQLRDKQSHIIKTAMNTCSTNIYTLQFNYKEL